MYRYSFSCYLLRISTHKDFVFANYEKFTYICWYSPNIFAISAKYEKKCYHIENSLQRRPSSKKKKKKKA